MSHMSPVFQDTILPQETHGCAPRGAFPLWELQQAPHNKAYAEGP